MYLTDKELRLGAASQDAEWSVAEYESAPEQRANAAEGLTTQPTQTEGRLSVSIVPDSSALVTTPRRVGEDS